MMKYLYIPLLLVLLQAGTLQAQTPGIRDTVSREDKLYALSLIWKEAADNFVFFDQLPQLNWDSLYRSCIPKILAARNVFEYTNVLSYFLQQLKDGHTGLVFNQNYWNQVDSPPVRYESRSGGNYITAVEVSLKDSVPPGAEITAINGHPLSEFRPEGSWYGANNSPVQLTLALLDGQSRQVTLRRCANLLFRAKKLNWYPLQAPVNDEAFSYRSLSSQTAYVCLNTFDDPAVVDSFKRVLPELRKHRRLILDIRQNQGGDDANAIPIASYLTDMPLLTGPSWRTRISNAAKRAWASMDKRRGVKDTLQAYLNGDKWEWHRGDTVPIPAALPRLNMPVYILTSRNTASAAEDFLIYLRGSGNIKTVGTLTAGSSGQPEIFALPMGFSARICAKRDALPDGSDYIHTGLAPDIKTATADEALAKALELISKAD